VANYSVKGPGGSWDPSDNGVYTITLRAKAIADTSGKTAAGNILGRFTVIIPQASAPPVVVAPAVATDVKRSNPDNADLLV
jgi:hypothetical protein